MGILDFFKKKAPGQCSSCQSNVANYRCPSCGTEHCESCVQASLQTLKQTGSGPRISIVSGGIVDTGASKQIGDRVAQQMAAMRALAEKGKGVCLGCSIKQGKAIQLKKV